MITEAAKLGREDAWRRASKLSREDSPWELEFFKASLGDPEVTIGLSQILAEHLLKGEPVYNKEVLRSSFFDRRALEHVQVQQGVKISPGSFYRLRDRIVYLAGTLIALIILLKYLIRSAGNPADLPEAGSKLLAVHAEWTNRTRHILEEQRIAPAAIIILGRPSQRLHEVTRAWTEHLGRPLPQAIVPASFRAAVFAFPGMLRLFTKGFSRVVSQPFVPGLRDMSAIVFRVMLGAVMRRWWLDSGFRDGVVIYGHTGTADTTMLESAQQQLGTRTVHVVHGLSTGPNFVGFSDSAWFRCGYDVDLYAKLNHYGACLSVSMEKPKVRRGKDGLLLMTNYAHPMNPGYRARGLEDELRVLREVAKAAYEAGSSLFPLRWKPHPVIYTLPGDQQQRLRCEAAVLGFEEVDRDSAPEALAMNARLLLTTPSTVAVDLLRSGTLAIVLDWQEQGPGFDSPPLQFPSLVKTTEELVVVISRLDEDKTFGEFFDNAWNLIQPAGSMIPGETGDSVS